MIADILKYKNVLHSQVMYKKRKILLTLLTKCDIVKNALLWQDMPTSLFLADPN